MKKFLSIAAIGAAAFSASSAMAASPANSTNSTLDVQEIRDRALLNNRAAREVFRSVRGTYALADGTTLSIYPQGAAFVAEVSGQSPVEVLATRSGTLVAVNGAAELRFVHNAGGQVANVVLTRAS